MSCVEICAHGGPSQRSLYPLLKAAYDEAKTIAVTPEQKRRLHNFAEFVALAWIAPEPLGDRGALNQQIERFIRENLQ